MIKKWVSIFCFIFMMVTTVVWAKPDSAYVDNGNGTVTDIETKLMWQQATAVKWDWDYAGPYCKKLRLAGYTDWRLPALDELKTLVDLDGRWLTINYTYFPDTVASFPSFYWSSSDYSVLYEWGVDFYSGLVNYSNKYNLELARVLRIQT